jgi:hypothetical protein
MTIQRPSCPKCKATMMLARIIPATPSRFDIRTFGDLIHQLVAELIDPMKSLEITGWFRGELHAPT